jgi:hypothetical protein
LSNKPVFFAQLQEIMEWLVVDTVLVKKPAIIGSFELLYVKKSLVLRVPGRREEEGIVYDKSQEVFKILDFLDVLKTIGTGSFLPRGFVYLPRYSCFFRE